MPVKYALMAGSEVRKLGLQLAHASDTIVAMIESACDRAERDGVLLVGLWPEAIDEAVIVDAFDRLDDLDAEDAGRITTGGAGARATTGPSRAATRAARSR